MAAEDQRPKPKNQKPIDWPDVKRVLVVKLRSIGDTVLATPSLIALKKFLPHAQVDILLEDWVAPVLDGFDAVDSVITVEKDIRDRLRVAQELATRGYDIAFNLHGGTTSTFFSAASRARHRVGYANYRYSFLYNHLLSSSSDFWGREFTHSAEQQLALLGSVGVPVGDRPKSRLNVTESSLNSVKEKLGGSIPESFALLHPGTAFFTKQWPEENFARVVEHLSELGLATVAIASIAEKTVLDELARKSRTPITRLNDLTLPDITALASKAKLFVGNDSGIAHIAAAVRTPTVVIFGSSNRNHWYPWTDTPNEIVFEEFACQPCPGYKCEVYGEPKCILSVKPEKVIAAIERVTNL